MSAIIKGKVRILRPSEYSLLRAALKPSQQDWLDALLFTGMRYVEMQRLQANPQWFDGNFVNLPAEAQKKVKRRMKDRSVRLNNLGRFAVERFLKGKELSGGHAWFRLLKRAALKAKIGAEGISVKTTRKTWESWLVHCFEEKALHIALSQGHTTATQYMYYLNMPFVEQDKLEMQKWVENWNIN